MKITAIGLHLVECRLPEPQGHATAFFDRRGALLVEVRSDEGVAGWGETWHSPAAAWTIIETTLAPAVLGQDPFEYQRLWGAMHARLGYERQGPGLMALSAVDMALWDLRGRALGQPIARLLGGPVRTRVPAYAGGPYLKRHVPGGGVLRRQQVGGAVNPIFLWVIAHTPGPAAVRTCPACRRPQSVPKTRRGEDVTCKACGSAIPRLHRPGRRRADPPRAIARLRA